MAKNWFTSMGSEISVLISQEARGLRGSMRKKTGGTNTLPVSCSIWSPTPSSPFYQERQSATWKETRPLVKEIWNTAQRLGIKEFEPRVRYEVNDDHVPLYRIGKIPVIDVIDFAFPEYPSNRYWHTTADAPGRCSADSLNKVGTVIMQWLATKP